MAGLELADQVDRGVLPPPDRVYVALGTGGMATGLSIGLQLGGVGAEVIAVATVERLLTGSWRLRRHADAVRAALSAHSIAAPAPALTVVRDQLGGGYGRPTGTGEAAKALAGAAGIGLESIYTAKAMAALLADVGRGGRALMWVTCRREAPLPTASGWTRRLPGALRRRLDRSPGSWRRRRLLIGGAAATVVVGARVTGYDAWDGAGHVLADWEAHVLHACARALLPPAPDDGLFSEIPKRVDRYVQSMPPRGRLELHAALATIEHGTTPLTLRWSRVTACDSDEVRDYLETLARRGGLQRQLYRAARDLCMLGYYQQPATWPEMGYDGPLARPTTLPAHYTGLRAPEGAAPPGWTPV